MTKNKLREKSIFFNRLVADEMIQAILNGQKTQARFLVNPQPNFPVKRKDEIEIIDVLLYEHLLENCAYGKMGDRLWIKETWRHAMSESHKCYAYRAGDRYQCGKPIPLDEFYQPNWEPSVRMPKEACRIFLEITHVYLERLQQITETDAIAQGIDRCYVSCDSLSDTYYYKNYINSYTKDSTVFTLDAIASFRSLWEFVHGIGSWEANNWVWAIAFKLL